MIQDLAKLIEAHKRLDGWGNSDADRSAEHDIASSQVRLDEVISVFNYALNNFDFRTLLDAGAGVGVDSAWWAERGKDVTAVTLFDNQVLSQMATEHGFKAVTGDIHDLPFDDGVFDCVLIKHTLEHSLLPMVVFEEIRRVLKPDGFMIIGVPPGSNDALEGHFIPGWNREQLEYLTRVCGFKVLFSDQVGWSASVLCQRLDESYVSDFFSRLG
jgi:2-polyprenyl-3-methyl-5-hydroxy-6-metoxy-1,4-benzoquinol methylase